MKVTYKRLRDIQLPAFESALRHSCLFASPDRGDRRCIHQPRQLVETVTAELESVARPSQD